MARFALAVDIGGTKILTALVRDDGTVVARSRVDTPGRGGEPVLGAVVGTVEGVVRGRGRQGARGECGEVGHMNLPLHGPPCTCARSTGCLEVLASGTAIARMAREAVESGRRSAVLEMAGGRPEGITAAMVEAAAPEGG